MKRIFGYSLLMVLLLSDCVASDTSKSSEEETTISADEKNDSDTNVETETSTTEELPTFTLERVSFESAALEKEMAVDIYLPPNYDSSVEYPVLYLLHEFNGSKNCVA